MIRVQTLEVVVQPVFVILDGDKVTKQVAEPVVVPAEDWPTFATTTHEEGRRELEKQLNDAKPPNRATRRAATKRKTAAKRGPKR